MRTRTCFATIASGNYLAYARVLRDSVSRHMPEAAFRLLIVDRRTAALDSELAETGLSATYAEQLGLPDFELIAYKFDVVELNTALKPSFLKQLFTEGYEQVVYLDPDIQVLAPPEPVLAALHDCEIVLTPHALRPVMDGKRPSDIDFLRGGTFNLGFVGLRAGANARAFLDWWERRCLALGFNDATFGVFVDQKWVDLAPSYFDSVRVLRHPGCNVAYWNLHERTLERSASGYTANGQTLSFFHFSGVDALRPERLSRHQNRHVPPLDPIVSELVQNYCAALLAAGHERYRGNAYGYAVLDDGSPISPLMRRASGCSDLDVSRPFAADSQFQRELRARGLAQTAAAPAPQGDNTLTFDAGDKRVRTVNSLVRLLARIAGAQRVALLLRYATFLSWGSNLPAVLLRRPPDLGHHE
ncbi:hypothetical protein JJB11_06635 [Ramlibacter ginsenosidimutans]|uniref:Glycosyl transferase n=1 Tax=Ramlibacter ginsenosidimutans TaxID=502333 RepID=A0A934TS86_9BURK|nr:hypothetical protein [Ramlibacter ginsenosidimutans]MBK6005767.1 hypothetical protein [Ramlibacter ginsenosidimutans]